MGIPRFRHQKEEFESETLDGIDTVIAENTVPEIDNDAITNPRFAEICEDEDNE